MIDLLIRRCGERDYKTSIGGQFNTEIGIHLRFMQRPKAYWQGYNDNTSEGDRRHDCLELVEEFDNGDVLLVEVSSDWDFGGLEFQDAFPMKALQEIVRIDTFIEIYASSPSLNGVGWDVHMDPEGLYECGACDAEMLEGIEECDNCGYLN